MLIQRGAGGWATVGVVTLGGGGPATLSPPSIEVGAEPGEPGLSEQLLAPSIAAGAAPGAPRLVAHLHPPSAGLAASLGPPVVHATGIVLDSIALSMPMTLPGVGAEGALLNQVSAVAVCRLGLPRVANSSLLVPGLEVGASPGPPVLVKLDPPSLESTFELGAPALVSPLRQFEPAVAAFELGEPALLDAGRRFSLFIGPNEASRFWVTDSGLDISMSLSGRTSARFATVDPANAYRPQVGQQVRFFFGEELIFGGFITETEETAPSGANTLCRTAVFAAGWASILDRRVVFGYWDGIAAPAYPAFIADSLRVRFLMSDGFHSISTGLALAQDAGAMFLQPQTATEAFNRLASATGVDYFVDEHKVIYWVPPGGTGPAPATLIQSAQDGIVLANSLAVRSASGPYRNRQYVNVARAVSPEFTEEALPLLPLPNNTTYAVTFPLTDAPTGTVYGTLGEHELEFVQGPGVPTEGWDAVWFEGSANFTLNAAADFWNTIGIIERVEVTYLMMDGLNGFVTDEDPSAIAARNAIEGGSGLWESVENATDIETREQAEALAAALLERYGGDDMPQEISFETDTPGWRPGQKVTVDYGRPLVSGDFLVTEVSIREISASLLSPDPFLRYSVSASSIGQMRRLQPQAPQNRSRAIDAITFSLARSLPGSENPGLDVGENIAGFHAVVQQGLFADASLVFVEPPEGSPTVIEVKVQDAPANPWDTPPWVTLVTLAYEPNRRATLVRSIGQPARRLQRLRVDVVSAGSEFGGSDATLRVRILQ